MVSQNTSIQNNEKKKCGLFTFHIAQNYGAFFQTYALVIALRKIGIETEVIDYRPDYLEAQQFERLLSIKIPPPISIRKLVTKVLISIGTILNYKQKKKKNDLFQNAVSKYLPLSKNCYFSESDLKADSLWDDKYMLIIAGSDQIWNSKLTDGSLDPVYFLSCVQKHKRKIAYAASMGDIKLPKREEDRFHSLVQNFEYISLREKSAIPYVQASVNIPLECTLDPTLLLCRDEWDKFACEPVTHPKTFMVVYYHGSIRKSYIMFARKVAKQYQLEIVWINTKNCYLKYVQTYIYPSLEEFIWYFSHAEFILTDSFHGTIFSIINKKPFYSIVSGWQKIRLIDNLERLGIVDRFFESPNDIVEINKDIDYSRVDNKLHELQKLSYQYLKFVTEVE